MCLQLMNFNFLDTDVISNLTESSEQASFPVENIFNKQRRSKVWRSNGFWEITSSNNTVIFRETNAIDLTATIATGEYTSTSSFIAAIKSAFDTAGASTYTVEQDTSTLKLKITSNGAGGDGRFELIWTDGSSAGAAAILGFDTNADDTGALNYTADVLKIHTDEWVQFDLGISSNPEAFILTGARNRPLRVTPSATIKLQGNETDNWTSPSFDQTLTYDDENIILIDTTGLHTEALRYWRVLFDDESNANGYVEVGAMYLGEIFTVSRGGPQFPFTQAAIDRSKTIFSEGGQTFSDRQPKTESFSFKWGIITKEDKEQLRDFFETVGTSVPFFVSFDPESVFSTSDNRMVRYVKFDQEPQYTLESPNNFSVTWSLREEL